MGLAGHLAGKRRSNRQVGDDASKWNALRRLCARDEISKSGLLTAGIQASPETSPMRVRCRAPLAVGLRVVR